MSNAKDSNQTQQKAPAEPNKAVEAPKVTFVLDHATPKVEKGSQQINESKKITSEITEGGQVFA